MPDAVVQQEIIRRDGSRCCLTGRPGRLWDPLVVKPILPVPTRWIAEPGRDTILDMLSAFFGLPYRDWWLSYSQDPQFMSPYHTHWLIAKSAAYTFSRGVIKLDRLQPSMVEFKALHVPIGPEDSIQLDGSYPLLGDHSRAGILKIDPRFVGTHARLCKSVQLIELADKFLLQGTSTPALLTSEDSKTKQQLAPGITSLMQPLFSTLLASWLVIPVRVRILAYRTLRRAAQRFIEPECETVQRLPFGLYLKCAGDIDSLRNEVNALRTVRRYTSIPAPKLLDFVAASAPAEDDPDCEEGYLLMSRLPGVPLSRCHQVLSDNDADQITAQLQDYVTQLRAVPRDTAAGARSVICDTLGGACRDARVRFGTPIGPFADEAAFNKVLRNPDDPARTGHHIFFTHADLNPRNILVNRAVWQDGSLGWRVTGIVDWEMAGYYPEYWEYTKALYERFRWTRRYQNMIHCLFRVFGDYSKEYDVELRSWEAGI